MSDELKGHSQPSVDPEKGLLDSLTVQLPYNADVKAPLSTPESKEKDTAVTTTTEVVVAAKPSKAPPKPKKKVPLWIVWTLWFNTYRYIAFQLQQSQMLNPSLFPQEIFHLLLRLQHDWPRFGGIRTFPLCH